MSLLFAIAFLQIRLLDIIDVFLVAFLFYQLYMLIRGTGAMNIFLGILSIYLIWWLVRLFEMELLTAILQQFISVGVLALIIVFQPEIRKFLLVLGKESFISKGSRRIFRGLWQLSDEPLLDIPPIVNTLEAFSEQKTGALLVITLKNELESFVETGERLDAKLSEQLFGSIFFRNSPLHDGAVIIRNNRVVAARCVLPVSSSTMIPTTLGLRHRAALGITEQSDAIALTVSEQTGRISWCKAGKIYRNLKPLQVKEFLAREFYSAKHENTGQKDTSSFFDTLIKKVWK